MRIKRVLIIVVAVLAAAVAAVFIMGALSPESHTASITVELDAPPSEVWRLIRDLEGTSEWREGVSEVRRLPDRPTETYAESSQFGLLHYAIEEEEPGVRLVTRIVDNKDFGGTWTYELSPGATPDQTVLTVTENGEIYSWLFRFFARFVFGYSGTLEAYTRDLEARVSS